jgi:hypothetical protein
LILASVTSGKKETKIPTDKINQEFVLGNKVMFGTVNANRTHFEAGVRDMALAEATHPGWLARLLTHRVDGLDRHKELFAENRDAIKVFCEVAA